MGGFPTIPHNEMWDHTADLLLWVCHDVCRELPLQPLSEEPLSYLTTNQDDSARLDIRANGFWGLPQQQPYFDVRVFNPSSHAYRKQELAACYRKHEREKQRAYGQRVREIERGSFIPLVFNTTGGMRQAATTTCKRLASLMAFKQEQPYSVVMGWMRCWLNFSLLRSAIMCLGGSRSTRAMYLATIWTLLMWCFTKDEFPMSFDSWKDERLTCLTRNLTWWIVYPA